MANKYCNLLFQENEDSGSSSDEAAEGAAEQAEPAEPAEPPPPGSLEIAWSFVSSFFSSLVPQPPPAVQANWDAETPAVREGIDLETGSQGKVSLLRP